MVTAPAAATTAWAARRSRSRWASASGSQLASQVPRGERTYLSCPHPLCSSSRFTNGSASILWGALEGSLGIFPTLSLGALLMIASLWLTSFVVPIYSHTDFLILYVSIPLTGLGSAACSPGILLGAVGKLFKDESMRAKAMGYTFALSSAGGIAIPPLIAILIAACAESVHPLAFHRRAED